eukprot:SAG31_NODE_17161_length_681_cov_0.891753_1_plen_149_part_10
MALFSRLMGPKVLGLELTLHENDRSTGGTAGRSTVEEAKERAGLPTNASKMLRGYAHCSRAVAGGVTVLLINLASNTTFEVSPPQALAETGPPHPEQLEWHLTAVGGDIHGKSIALDGGLLALEAGNAKMPSMPGRPSTSKTVVVDPAS